MADWTDELRKTVVEEYTKQNPNPETSTEIVAEIAESHNLTPNGVRSVLVKAGVYVSKAKATGAGEKKAGTRASKGQALEELANIIRDQNLEVNDEIISKLTGKAAVYFSEIMKEIIMAKED